MASISSPGIGSGLDVNGLVSKLMAVEQLPLTALQTQEADYQAKLSAFGSLKASLSTLQTSANALMNPSTFTLRSATASDPTVLAASATNSAAAGNYNITVTTLAKNLTIRSDTAYANTTDTFNLGSLDITVGTNTKTVTIDGTNNTLDGIRGAINAAGAGVTATIVNDGTTNRLVLTATNTGSAGAFTVTPTDSGSGGTNLLSNLAYAGGAGVAGQILQVQNGDDAALSVNGLGIVRSNNIFSDVITGVTFNLTKAGSTMVTVAPNNATIFSSITSFISNYNASNKMLHDVAAYTPSLNQPSVLTGDLTVMNMRSQLTNAITASVTGLNGGIASLSDIGISVQKDGSLQADTTKLMTMLNDPNNDVAGLFTSSAVGNQGLGVRLNDALTSLVGPTGIISNRTDGLNSSISDITKQSDELQVRLTATEAAYRAQFTALDTLMSSMQTTANYLTQQLNTLSQMNAGILSRK